MANYTYGSPGITLFEEDRATVVIPQNITSAAIVIDSNWGPGDTQLLSTEADLVNIYGTPTDSNYKDWLAAANFLNYSNSLRVLRAIAGDKDDGTPGSKNSAEKEEDAIQIISLDHFTSLAPTLSGKESAFYARCPGDAGNNIKILVADKYVLDAYSDPANSALLSDELKECASILSQYTTKILTENEVSCAIIMNSEIKEFNIYSFDTNAKQFSGSSNYMPIALNRGSEYAFVVENIIVDKFKATTENITKLLKTLSFTATDYAGKLHELLEDDNKPLFYNVQLSGGTYVTPSDGDYMEAWDTFSDADTYDVGLLIQGGASNTVGNYLSVVAARRRDAVACVSPQEYSVVGVSANTAIKQICNDAEALGLSSYSFMDGNYKYQYDKWNDKYRWVPVNGDIAGIMSKVDLDYGPWRSPGRQSILNCIKFALNPTKAQRDELWKYHVNPCISFNDTGPILFGDQTGADQSYSFNFVNVRRLMLYVEKTLMQHVRSIMFAPNDENTRTEFVQSITPFLSNLVGSRAMTEYRIICDASNNPLEVVNMGKFVAHIYIKPIRSIRYIELSIISTGSDVTINEMVV